MGRLEDLLDAEAIAVEVAEADQDSSLRTDVRITRGHSRSRTLQVRLNDGELDDSPRLPTSGGCPSDRGPSPAAPGPFACDDSTLSSTGRARSVDHFAERR